MQCKCNVKTLNEYPGMGIQKIYVTGLIGYDRTKNRNRKTWKDVIEELFTPTDCETKSPLR